MKVSINQPAYLPWLGYFDRIDYADIHVVLDHVQVEKNSYTNRNKIISNNGTQWITIPISKGVNGEKSINKIRCIDNKKWIKNHLNSISQNYSKAPFFSKYFNPLRDILQSKIDSISFLDIIEAINFQLFDYLGITTPIIYSSTLGIESKKSNLILDICKDQQANEYISGIKGKDYLDTSSFNTQKIKILYQSYTHPIYKQKNEDFISNLSVLDLLFHEVPRSLSIIREGRNYIAC